MSLWDKLSGADPAKRTVDKWWEFWWQKDPRCDQVFREVLEDEDCHRYVVEHLGIGVDGNRKLLDALVGFSRGSGVRLYPFLLERLIFLHQDKGEGYEPLLERVSCLGSFPHWCLTQYLMLLSSEGTMWCSEGLIRRKPTKEENTEHEFLVELLAKSGERAALLLLFESPSPKTSGQNYSDYQSLFCDVIRYAVTTRRIMDVNPPSLMATLRTEFSKLAGSWATYLDLFETLPENRRDRLEDLLFEDRRSSLDSET